MEATALADAEKADVLEGPFPVGTEFEEVFAQPGEGKDRRFLPRPSGNNGTPGFWSSRQPDCQHCPQWAMWVLTALRLVYQSWSHTHTPATPTPLSHKNAE